MTIEIEADTLTIRQLRRRWKPHKERLTAEQPENPTPIRFHRACSWIARVEQNGTNEEHDPQETETRCEPRVGIFLLLDAMLTDSQLAFDRQQPRGQDGFWLQQCQ